MLGERYFEWDCCRFLYAWNRRLFLCATAYSREIMFVTGRSLKRQLCMEASGANPLIRAGFFE